MYKNGGVSHSHPATKQPEWSTKSLLYWETDRKKNYFQHPKCPTWLTTWTWSTSWSMTSSKLNGFRCERPNGNLLLVNIRSDGADVVDVWTLCQDVGYIKWALVHMQSGASDKKDAGLTQVCKHIHLYKGAWVKHGDKWRASCSCPPLELLSIMATFPPRGKVSVLDPIERHRSTLYFSVDVNR